MSTFLILPSEHRYRALPWVPKHEWREPSQAQQKDQFGNPNSTWFRVTARLDDGLVQWRGWFRSREDCDAFLWALATGSLPQERALWGLSTPSWHPDMAPFAVYAVDTVNFLTATSASNQTWTSYSDWNNASNSVEVIAGGGTGGLERASAGLVGHSTGGGAGGYSKTTSLNAATPGTTTKTFRLEAAVTLSLSSNSTSAGTAGKDAWFDGTTLGGSTVGAQHGSGGATGAGSQNGGVGGATASGTGSTKQAGGRGGNMTGASGTGVSGGGGAGGLHGDGNQGVDTTSTGSSQRTAGGQGDSTFGGAAGAAALGSSTGGNGAEWTATDTTTAGSGGGGGAGVTSSAGTFTSTGGNYGAAGGAMGGTGASTTVASTAAQGIIVLTYTPVAAGGGLFRAPNLNGLGSGGPFFNDPLALPRKATRH